MNKSVFLNTLKNELNSIPKSDRDDILYDYNEHFSIGIKAGRLESEIASSLGDPVKIAKEIIADYKINTSINNNSNIFNSVLAAVGLVFFNLVFVLGPYIGIAATLFSLFISGIAISISGIVLIATPFLDEIFPSLEEYITFHPLGYVLIGIGLIAMGILFVIFTSYLSKLFYQLTIKYLKVNQNIILNRRNKNE